MNINYIYNKTTDYATLMKDACCEKFNQIDSKTRKFCDDYAPHLFFTGCTSISLLLSPKFFSMGAISSFAVMFFKNNSDDSQAINLYDAVLSGVGAAGLYAIRLGSNSYAASFITYAVPIIVSVNTGICAYKVYGKGAICAKNLASST